jgi:hypothetical protein
MYKHKMTCAIAAFVLLCGCAHVAPRPAVSSYGCMQRVRASLPPGLPDKRAHCLASGLIAHHCSVAEAYAAGGGKELHDMVGKGDAEWADWHADRVGIRCAREAADDAAVEACCLRALQPAS